jgi:mannose-6-phosphate isomerase-like protein (cupin superfamily)
VDIEIGERVSVGAVDRVNKPWGYEFRVRLGSNLTLTYLTLYPGSQTSLHCHPQKTTSLTAISGTGTIRFLKDSIEFSSGTSFMVRNGLFHQIYNSGQENLIVLEFENPSDAMDLVRLEDEYGRSLTSYELKAESNSQSKTEEEFFSFIANGGVWSNSETEIIIISPKNSEPDFIDDAVYAVLEGGLRDRVSNSLILREGDCTSTSTIQRLVGLFEWDPTTRLLQIKKKSLK